MLVGGLEAQLPFSGEGINIPEGLQNKAIVTPQCHLKTQYLNVPLKPMSQWRLSIQKSKANKIAQVLKSIYLSIYLLTDTIKIAKSFRTIQYETL